MKKTYVFLAFVIIIIASSIYPVIYHYKDKNIPELTNYIDWKTALLKQLPDSVNSYASKFKLKDYVLPVDSIKGDIVDLPHIKEYVNLSLLSYKKWKVKVEKNEVKLMEKILDNNLKEYGPLFSSKKLKQIAFSQAKINLKSRYKSDARLLKLPTEAMNNLLLIVSLKDNLKQNTIFEVKIPFIHPDTLKQLKANRLAKINKIEELRKKAEFSLTVLKATVGLFAVYLLFLFGAAFYRNQKEKKYIEFLQTEISKRNQLIDEGHFVAALKLAEKYLEKFPDDMEIFAFKERILDYTNNDPHKAQIAFVEAKKLGKKLRLVENNPKFAILSEEEKKEIKALLDFNPQLKNSFLQLESAEEKIRQKENSLEQIEKVKLLINSSNLSEAENILKSVTYIGDNKEILEELNMKIKFGKEKGQELWGELIRDLINNTNINFNKKLSDIASFWADMPNIINLKEYFGSGKNSNRYRFVSIDSKFNKEILLLYGMKFTFGREDINVKPDIVLNDRRISRPHAKIYLENNKIFIEDLNSHVGTFVNGNKITKAELKNNDLLTLGKVIDFKLKTYGARDNSLDAFLLIGDKHIIVFLLNLLNFGILKDQFDLRQRKYFLRILDERIVLIDDENLTVITGNVNLNLNNFKFNVEDLNEKT